PAIRAADHPRDAAARGGDQHLRLLAAERAQQREHRRVAPLEILALDPVAAREAELARLTRQRGAHRRSDERPQLGGEPLRRRIAQPGQVGRVQRIALPGQVDLEAALRRPLGEELALLGGDGAERAGGGGGERARLVVAGPLGDRRQPLVEGAARRLLRDGAAQIAGGAGEHLDPPRAVLREQLGELADRLAGQRLELAGALEGGRRAGAIVEVVAQEARQAQEVARPLRRGAAQPLELAQLLGGAPVLAGADHEVDQALAQRGVVRRLPRDVLELHDGAGQIVHVLGQDLRERELGPGAARVVAGRGEEALVAARRLVGALEPAQRVAAAQERVGVARICLQRGGQIARGAAVVLEAGAQLGALDQERGPLEPADAGLLQVVDARGQDLVEPGAVARLGEDPVQALELGRARVLRQDAPVDRHRSLEGAELAVEDAGRLAQELELALAVADDPGQRRRGARQPAAIAAAPADAAQELEPADVVRARLEDARGDGQRVAQPAERLQELGLAELPVVLRGGIAGELGARAVQRRALLERRQAAGRR